MQILYSVYVGGDAWEYWGGSNRYIAIVMPEFFVLLSFALFQIADTFVSTVQTRSANRVTLAAFAALVTFSILTANSIYGVRAWLEVLLIHPPLHSGKGGENQGEVEQALMLRRITTPEAVIAVVRAGTIPYFADRPSIDLLGKNDCTLPVSPRKCRPAASASSTSGQGTRSSIIDIQSSSGDRMLSPSCGTIGGGAAVPPHVLHAGIARRQVRLRPESVAEGAMGVLPAGRCGNTPEGHSSRLPKKE